MKKSEKLIDLKSLRLEELQNYFVELGASSFRGKQAFNWIYGNLISDFDEMQNLPISLRNQLKDNASINSLRLLSKQGSNSTNTNKYLFETVDGNKIESVIIPEQSRRTLCLSTQVGCPLDCKFCATGLMGYTRNLSTGEIIDQYIQTSKQIYPNEITNIVYMGMGEPLLNYAATEKSLQILLQDLGNKIGRTRITVSTAGIPQNIIKLADSGLRVKLALSLHSCFEEVRNKIMPINVKYSLAENIDALKYYARKTKTKIMFEYTMLHGINDRDEDLNALKKLCSQLPSKVNIIPFNSIAHMVSGGFSSELKPTPLARIKEFAEKLMTKDIFVMMRNTQGDDIAAACGQLAIKGKR
ncbi:MAG: 23S rRNA (adenine(2503)-C(2))-methyltransferase RlmN [Ignavibacteriales bacterium]|nr:23S rRNA (adenine(2503)-C(2))-methyltransferase RlmN [Ignavibacteriales bacterium]MCB9219027.1 23S rRNA (adenine(2503)-C(2))-methyltransferase RlmN [Ignavibacteriales bacterium]